MPMELAMRDTGEMIASMDRVKSAGLTQACIEVTMKMVSKMEQDFSVGKMVPIIICVFCGHVVINNDHPRKSFLRFLQHQVFRRDVIVYIPSSMDDLKA